ncbi:MAG: hypothetical protein J6P66_11340 [Bacteroidaceae bacterium]|nr:hypothetical protein [Bacteroidaceae bacterium]
MANPKRKYVVVLCNLLFVFFLSCKQKIESKPIVIDPIGKKLELSENVKNELNQTDDGILLYVENHTCSSCMEKTLFPLYCLLVDSFPDIHPLLIIHINETEEVELNEHYKSVFRIMATKSDSVRINNDWIPNSMVYYGFLLDEHEVVKTFGFLSSKIFVEDCNRYFKTK